MVGADGKHSFVADAIGLAALPQAANGVLASYSYWADMPRAYPAPQRRPLLFRPTMV